MRGPYQLTRSCGLRPARGARLYPSICAGRELYIAAISELRRICTDHRGRERGAKFIEYCNALSIGARHLFDLRISYILPGRASFKNDIITHRLSEY